MKELKIVKEKKIGQEDWYCIYVDDIYIMGSYDKERINLFFKEIEENPNLHLKSKETIKSTTINID
jgi:hypothetical protein